MRAADRRRRLAGTVNPHVRLFARNLRAARQAAGWSQQDMERRSGICRPVLSDIERGLHNVMLETAGRLARALGRSTAELLAGSRR